MWGEMGGVCMHMGIVVVCVGMWGVCGMCGGVCGVGVGVYWYTNKHVLRVQTHSSHCKNLKKYVLDIYITSICMWVYGGWHVGVKVWERCVCSLGVAYV